MEQHNLYKQTNLSRLTHKLKREDRYYSFISAAVILIYTVMVIVFTVSLVRDLLTDGSFKEIAENTCFLIAMLILVVFFTWYYKLYKHVDYSLPTLLMLKKAAYRYQPFQLESLWLIPALILIDIGLALKHFNTESFMHIQLSFVLSIFIGVCIGLVIWFIRYKDLHDGAKQLIREIENGEEMN